MNKYLSDVKKYLIDSWGLNSKFADQISIFIYWLFYYNLSPRITSGFRDPSYQQYLRMQWDAGNRTGLRARPAEDSLHSHKSLFGSPDSLAIDISTSDDRGAASIAHQLGIGCGEYYMNPDPGHYYKQ